MAKKEKKVVMVDFVTPWCAPCKVMDMTTWKDPKVTEWLEKHTVAIKVDGIVNMDLANKYEVSIFPTMLFSKPNGEEIARIIGQCDADIFPQKAADILSGKSKGDRAEDRPASNAESSLIKAMETGLLIKQKQYAEAFENCKWLIHDEHSLGPAEGVDLLEQVAEHFEPARVYMQSLEVDAASKMRAGSASLQDVKIYVVVARRLKPAAEMLAFHDELQRDDASMDKSTLQLLRRMLFAEFLEAERYQDIVEDEPDMVAQGVEGTMKGTGLSSRFNFRHIPISPSSNNEAPNINDLMVEAKRRSMISDAEDSAQYYRVLLALERGEEAQELANRLLAKYEEIPAEVNQALAVNGLKSGKPIQENERQARKALELSKSKNVQLVVTLSRLLLALGKKQESLELIQESLPQYSEQPSDAELLRALQAEIQQAMSNP